MVLLCWKAGTRGFDLSCLAYDAKSVRAVGRGLQPKGVRVGDLADFYVSTENAGEGGIMEVLVTGPGMAALAVWLWA